MCVYKTNIKHFIFLWVLIQVKEKDTYSKHVSSAGDKRESVRDKHRRYISTVSFFSLVSLLLLFLSFLSISCSILNTLQNSQK